MRNDYDSAEWAAHHSDLSAAVAAFVREIGAGFATLSAHRFAAPWRRAPRRGVR